MAAVQDQAVVKDKAVARALQPFVCGGTAACFASCIIHPIDLAKVRLQLFKTLHPEKKPPSFVTVLSTMVANEGVMSVYNGLSAALMRQAIYGTARIGLHRTFSDALSQQTGGAVPFWMKTISGMSSGAIAVCIGTPMDVALVRMQADSMKEEQFRRNYKNVIDALVRVASEEGFGKLYAGLAPNILRGMAMNVGMMACYDQAKETVMTFTGDKDPKRPSLSTKLASSAIAGFTAAAFSMPFDLMKSRLQDMKPNANGELPYTGLLDAAGKILTKEGPMAFYTGFGAYYFRCAPHAMTILLTIEYVNSLYRSIFGLK
uniref:Uncharacterized protein n=1 Tax=Pinguiococcus pyrenoidosus TaxID=172671 RepID=A0A7R9U5J4_9STRA|mmetsp:Transcript_15508/g.58954  ORF Transcript_15508/g.58954 Transcript_15508/m.58954 type:complete len:317 (+) Transcript_15508:136-1086(+)